MTNLLKFGVVALAAIMIATGCKKDDTPAVSFVVTGEASLHFNAGQTQKTQYRSQNLTGYTYKLPEGWSCSASNGIISITAPTTGGDEEGTVEITAATVNSTNITVKITVAIVDAVALESEPANSYIVSEPGKRFKFDARIRGNETTASMAADVDNAVLLWSAPDKAISHVSLDEDGYLYFYTKDNGTLVEGNALVAVRDAKNNVLWSWHIWVTDFDPATTPDILLSGKQIMSRNLGAFAASNDTEDNVLRSYGLYYQWGRKDPFPGPAAWNSTTQQYLYDSKSKAVVMSFATSSASNGTLAYAAANPTTFIAGVKETKFDWMWESDDDLWGDGGAKTLNDPCPAGWRVAPASIWADMSPTYEYYGCTLETSSLGVIFYPGAGRRNFANTLATSTKNYTNIIRPAGIGEPVEDKWLYNGFYWSSTPDGSTGRSKCMVFRAYDPATSADDQYLNKGENTFGELDPDTGAWSPEGARAGGFPLRCVKE